MNTDADCEKSNEPGEQLLNKQMKSSKFEIY
jgi:hypothetical protein